MTQNEIFAPHTDAQTTTTAPAQLEPINGAIILNDPMNVLNSKRFVKGGLECLSPSELLQPCIDLLQRSNGRLTLTGSNEISNANLDKSVNTSYGRLNLVSRYEIDTEIFYEVGVLVAYDLQVPKIKIYRGPKVSACTNLCIYQAEDIVKFDISSGVNLEQVQNFLSSLNDRIRQSVEITNRLKAIAIPPKAINEIIGAMLLKTINLNSANGTSPILKAAAMLTDPKSKYYHLQDGFNGWQLFNAFTEYFGASKTNFFDIPEKTRDTYQLLKDVCLS